MEGTAPAKPSKPAKPKQRGGPRPQLHTEERKNIRAYLLTLACSDAWAEHILGMLSQTDRHGRPVIKHKLDQHGFLKGEKKTKYAKLLAAVADALVYPVPADDQPWTEDGVDHTGSAMRPCYCLQCTRRNPDGTTRHVHWPASYMVKEHLSYTCSVNKIEVDEDELVEDAPESELLSDRGGRGISVGGAAEQMRVDENAWRSDELEDLARFARRTARELDAPELLLLDDPPIRAALEAHRWHQVTGGCGREKAKNTPRGLGNLGGLVHFIELGHSLADVRGISAGQAKLIAELVECYPREPRLRQVRIKWQETR